MTNEGGAEKNRTKGRRHRHGQASVVVLLVTAALVLGLVVFRL